MLKKTEEYITESLYCTPETNTTLQINYISIKIKKKKPTLRGTRATWGNG